jgi:hypothetical protein
MSSTTLTKPLLFTTVADAVYDEVTSRAGKYFYFIGQVVEWDDPDNPPTPVDSPSYEQYVRRRIVSIKQVQPGDVSYVVDRVNWTANTVYDMYDDQCSDQIIGIDLINGGSNYSANTTISITGGNGTGATANLTIADGVITSVNILNKGYGYTNNVANISVNISDTYGSGAVANAVLGYSYSGANTIQDANFYVLTEDYHIYKCLNNNNDSLSTVKPLSTQPEPFTLSDGYKWKFIGTVPLSLQSKFLSAAKMPVRTSLSEQFYSSGEIKKVNIINSGDNYTYASLVVVGDGYQEDNPCVIIQAVVENAGSGYYSNNTTVTIEPPISGTTNWLSANTYYTGQYLNYQNNIYEVIKSGVSGVTGPVHTRGTTSNGTVGLKYRATTLTANANVTATGTIDALKDLNGAVNYISLSESGSGYIDTPNVTISGGGGTGASAITILNGNSVGRVVMIDSGKDFTTTPTVVIGSGWVANASLTINTQVYYNTRLYTCTAGGTANTTPPTHTTGTQTFGTANLTYAGLRSTATAVLKYGSGYTRIPNVTITGTGSNATAVLRGDKSEAILYPVVEDGKIINIQIQDGGKGYTYASITAEGDGDNSEFDVSFVEGDVDSVQATSEILAVPGAIHAIKTVSQGYNYPGNVTVSVYGNGTGCTANAIVVNGRITKINVLTEGQNYTEANVVITTNTTGAGAVARPIIAPYYGHGKDPVSELHARSLAFYTTIGTDKNQGLVIENDFRQIGLIKDMRKYGDTGFFNNITGSACWLISGNINTSVFTEDATISRVSDSALFKIIASEDNAMLLTPLDDRTPVANDTFTYLGNTVFATDVTAPDVDKYSGKIIYIDNRLAFTPTENQSISIKSVFTY